MEGSVTRGMEFVASSRFTGARQGYVFKNGNSGTGYYIDRKAAGASQALPGGFFHEEPHEESGPDRKRGRDEYERKTRDLSHHLNCKIPIEAIYTNKLYNL